MQFRSRGAIPDRREYAAVVDSLRDRHLGGVPRALRDHGDKYIAADYAVKTFDILLSLGVGMTARHIPARNSEQSASNG